MKIENIHTDREGLQKIIEFLHSDKNILKIKDMFTPVFYLAETCTEHPGGYYGTSSPDIRYLISVKSDETAGPNPPKPLVDSLCDLVKEVYRK